MIWLLVVGVMCLCVAVAIIAAVLLLFEEQGEPYQEEPLVEEGEILG